MKITDVFLICCTIYIIYMCFEIRINDIVLDYLPYLILAFAFRIEKRVVKINLCQVQWPRTVLHTRLSLLQYIDLHF